MTHSKEPIAIVGLGCRYPGGANSPRAFWDILANGKRVTGPVPEERIKLVEETMGRKVSDEIRAKLVGGWLSSPIEEFDAKFFGLHPRDAASSDPGHRQATVLSPARGRATRETLTPCLSLPLANPQNPAGGRRRGD